MRRQHLIIALLATGILVLPCGVRAATTTQRAQQARSQQQSTTQVSAAEQRKAVVATQTASAEEQKVAQRVRYVELQLKREEQLLAQRLDYANRLRTAGLQKNDEKVLQQAETYERRSLAAFEQRVAQLEKMLQIPSTGTSSKAGTPTPSQRSQTGTSKKPATRSSAKPHSQSRLIRRR